MARDGVLGTLSFYADGVLKGSTNFTKGPLATCGDEGLHVGGVPARPGQAGNAFTRRANTYTSGGTCICPDRQMYAVGAQGIGCASLACVGGTPSQCTQARGAWSYNAVTCGSSADSLPGSLSARIDAVRLFSSVISAGEMVAQPCTLDTAISSDLQVRSRLWRENAMGWSGIWRLLDLNPDPRPLLQRS